MASFNEVASRVGQSIEGLRVMDVMSRDLITVNADQSLREVAKIFIEHQLHRLPVMEDRRLVGLLTSIDYVRLYAEQPSSF